MTKKHASRLLTLWCEAQGCKVGHCPSLNFARTRGGNVLFYLHELGAFVFIVCKYVESHGLAQFELMGRSWLARTKQPLPFRRTGNILDIRTIAIGQCALFYEVMSLAVWTLSI